MSQRSNQHIVGIHYAIGAKIGEGSFGVIFEGENILNANYNNGGKDNVGDGSSADPAEVEPVAIKFEPRRSDAPQLRDEFRAYRILNGCRGIPHAYYFGQEGMHNVLILDLLGPSLEDLFEWCGRRFSVKTTCLVAKQMIDRVRTIHDHDLIYRDIKPDNFLISEYQRNSSGNILTKSVAASANGDPNLIYMVDFGMAKQYRDPRTKQHIPYRERKSLSGTARYMSINTHFGREQSRRDDLESLGHVFFYFLRGSLPWQGLKAPNNKLKYEKIGLTKQKLNPDDLLTEFIPPQFATYLKYSRSLRFDEDPDYDYLISLMDDILNRLGMKDDGHYDWMDLNSGKGWDILINKRANLHGYGNANRRNNDNGNNDTNNNTGTNTPGNINSRTNQQSNHHNSLNYAKQKLKFINNNASFDGKQVPNQPVNRRTYDSMGNRILKPTVGDPNSAGNNNDYRTGTGSNLDENNAPYYNWQQQQNQPSQHRGKQFNQRSSSADQDSNANKGFFSKFCCCWC